MSDIKGLKMPRGKKETIEKYEITIPSLKEQQRIAAELCKLDKEAKDMKRQIESAPALKQSVLDKYLK